MIVFPWQGTIFITEGHNEDYKVHVLPWKPRNSIALYTIRLFSFSIVMKMDLILYNSKPDIVQVKLGTYTMTHVNHGRGRGKSIPLCI